MNILQATTNFVAMLHWATIMEMAIAVALGLFLFGIADSLIALLGRVIARVFKGRPMFQFRNTLMRRK